MPITPTTYAKVLVTTLLSNGHNAANVLWYVPNVPPSADSGFDVAVAFAGLLDGTVGLAIKAAMGADSQYIGTIVHLNIEGVTFTGTSAMNAGVGGEGGDSLPANCAAIIQKRTAFGGKTGRGRWYIGGLGESLHDQSQLTVAGQNLLAAIASELRAERTLGTGEIFQPCHLSGDTNLRTIIHCQPLLRLKSQRRRLLRGTF